MTSNTIKPLTVAGLGAASADEAAAVMAALRIYLEADEHLHHADRSKQIAWIRAARLESQGIPLRPATLRGGWRL